MRPVRRANHHHFTVVALEATMPTTITESHVTTAAAAKALGAKPHTPISSLSRFGHWLGMKPVKLPNGRLLWPASDIDKMLQGGGRHA